jgi:hypothetical protein
MALAAVADAGAARLACAEVDDRQMAAEAAVRITATWATEARNFTRRA